MKFSKANPVCVQITHGRLLYLYMHDSNLWDIGKILTEEIKRVEQNRSR